MTAGRIRLFVALDLPDEPREAIAGWAERVLDDRPGARRMSAGSLHLTLCFLGACDAGDVPGIGAACAAGVAGCAPVRLRLGEALLLPRRRPRVAGVAVDDAGGQLGRLQASLVRALVDGNWHEPERRPFLAHVTAARLSPTLRLARDEVLVDPPAQGFVASSVSLYRSHTGPAGARYEALTRVELVES